MNNNRGNDKKSRLYSNNELIFAIRKCRDVVPGQAWIVLDVRCSGHERACSSGG